MTQVTLPNPQGRPSGRHSPVDLDFIYRDPKDQVLPILLIASPPAENPELRSIAKNWHWKLAWIGAECPDAPAIAFRRLEIVNEIGYEYLTNWGPKTRMIHHNIWAKDLYVEVAKLSYDQRQVLEQIGLEVPVKIPDGQWNCQDWLHDVLAEAMKGGLWTEDEWKNAVRNLNEMIDRRITENRSPSSH